MSATYERFLDAVTTGRGTVSGLDKEALRKLAEGRVWTGAQAHERKLVDTLGGLADALLEARKRANLDADEDVSLDIMMGNLSSLSRLTGLAHLFAPTYGTYSADAVGKAARLLLGDPEALSFLLSNEGKALAVSPVSVRIR